MTDRGGWPAYPVTVGNQVLSGMSLRDYYRAHAPVTIQDVIDRLGIDKQKLTRDMLWRHMARLRDEYSSAMLALDDEEKS